MSWLKNKRRRNLVGDVDPCPCPEVNSGSLFSPGCITYANTGTRNACALFRDKWNTTDCEANYNTACPNPAVSSCFMADVDYVLCQTLNIVKGVGLFFVQWGALPLAIVGTAVAAGYIKSAES